MTPNVFTWMRSGHRTALAMMLCVMAIGPGHVVLGDPPLSADRLDSLVAPIALYPDPLLAQTLAAATYPSQVEELDQWLADHPRLQGDALATAVATQPWDPSVQSMAALFDLVHFMDDNIDWTTALGNAFVAQPSDVMDAVQRMRQRAERAGNLRSNDQQIVRKTVVENQPVIVIEPANPQTVYVPYYRPVMVFGSPAYPFPVFVSQPPAARMALSFGTGGGWGWQPGWGRSNTIMINRNNVFVHNSNFYRNRSTWTHNRSRPGA